MSPEEKKKNILDSAIDLLTNRDEKAAAAKAAADAKARQDAEVKARAEAEAKARADAKAKEEEEKKKAEQQKLANETYQKTQADMKAAKEAAAAAVLAEHTVQPGETLSGIAMKYYKSSTRESWMKIYEANKAVIGDNPGMIKAGQVFKIPKP
ncbi:MAG: LysM peptidoglycan-binding domain-containing protein [Leptolinea sp.]|nr:LysM peptidoglycan-binding domain-containing protein [Leptolinea sp.]